MRRLDWLPSSKVHCAAGNLCLLLRRWQNARMGLVITVVVLVAAYALVAVICSPTFKC